MEPRALDFDTLYPRLGSNGAWSAFGPIVSRALGLSRLNAIYARARQNSASAGEVASRILAELRIQIEIPEERLAELQALSGPVIFVANHPRGLVEALALVVLLEKTRPNSKILANFLLERIPEFRDRIIAVDPFGGAGSGARNLAPIRKAFTHLKDGGTLGVFPSGEIASIPNWRAREATERPWNSHIGALARRTRSTIVPVHFGGQNSALFQILSLIAPSARLALLPRETLGARDGLGIQIGAPLSPETIEGFTSDESLTDFLRLQTESLRTKPSLPASKCIDLERLADPTPDRKIAIEIDRLGVGGSKITECGDFNLYFFRRSEAPSILEEIGRLREESFRAEGEGSGLTRDLDEFDDHYRHLLAWDRVRGKIAGAYRIGFVDEILRGPGVSGLYTNTLFQFDAAFIAENRDAIELGRSFVTLEYRKEPLALHSLWIGLGQVLHSRPEIRTLFGPVSLSPDHSPVTQNLLVRFLKENRGESDESNTTRARTGFPEVLQAPLGIRTLNELQRIIQSAVDPEFRVPPLLKHYFKLGGKILGFNIDPKFQNTVDCLFYLRLAELDARVLRRYLPKN
jgi:putative hemolysin